MSLKSLFLIGAAVVLMGCGSKPEDATMERMSYYVPIREALRKAINQYHSDVGRWPLSERDLESRGLAALRFERGDSHGERISEQLSIADLHLTLNGIRENSRDGRFADYSYSTPFFEDDLHVDWPKYYEHLTECLELLGNCSVERVVVSTRGRIETVALQLHVLKGYREFVVALTAAKLPVKNGRSGEREWTELVSKPTQFGLVVTGSDTDKCSVVFRLEFEAEQELGSASFDLTEALRGTEFWGVDCGVNLVSSGGSTLETVRGERCLILAAPMSRTAIFNQIQKNLEAMPVRREAKDVFIVEGPRFSFEIRVPELKADDVGLVGLPAAYVELTLG